MKAAYITQTGAPDMIQYGELPDPKPGPTQCLIKVTAVDVNPIDLYVRSGAIAVPGTFPYILGRDLAGEVLQTGSAVTRFRKGDRVWATSQGYGGRPGTFSELAAVDESWLIATPPTVKDDDIAALSLVGITAHLGLFGSVKLKAGDILFVNGGTGGVGSAVLQMAKLTGAKVITTAGTDEKVAECEAMGADLAINYRTQNVDAAIKAFAPQGVSVWWESLSEPNFERAIALLAVRGRMIVMAGRAARPIFPVGPFYTKDCSLYGFAMYNSSTEEIRAAGDDLSRWLAEGKIKARVDRVLPLSKTAEAHRLQEESTIHKSGGVSGKIVLKP